MDIITMNKEEKNLLLLQFFGSSFPVGGFQHSYGLETYISKGLIGTVEELTDYLRSVIQQNYIGFDGRGFCKAYALAQQKQEDRLCKLDQELTAMRLSKENRIASLKTGKALLRISVAMIGDERLQLYLEKTRQENRLGNYCIVAGYLSGIMDIPLNQALQAFYYSDLNNLLQVGIKVIPLGQTEGQGILYSLYSDIVAGVAETIATQEAELENFVPYQNLMSMQHETLYSRLYMS